MKIILHDDHPEDTTEDSLARLVDRMGARLKELSSQRDEMLEQLKIADHALGTAGFQDIQPVRAGIRNVIAKAKGA